MHFIELMLLAMWQAVPTQQPQQQQQAQTQRPVVQGNANSLAFGMDAGFSPPQNRGSRPSQVPQTSLVGMVNSSNTPAPGDSCPATMHVKNFYISL
jgi:hypothetical protein